jgi:hypothetical protein
MKIVIHYPQGRLGNLLFQLVAANEIFTERSNTLTFASEATDYFEWPQNYFILPCPAIFRPKLTSMWMLMLKLLIKLRIFGKIEPKQLNLLNGYKAEDYSNNITKGLIRNIYVMLGFYQHNNYQLLRPKLKSNIMYKAESKIGNTCMESRVAVHFRFGDYNNFSIYGVEGTILPLDYYVKAFDDIEKNVKNPCYVVLSDDPHKADLVMKQIGKTYISSQGDLPIQDFATISVCAHAILSASTFSWWGAKLIENPNKIIIAPKFWLGFKTKTWFPFHIETKEFKYISVN